MQKSDELQLDAHAGQWWQNGKPKTLPDFGLGGILEQYADLYGQIHSQSLTVGPVVILHQEDLLQSAKVAMQKIIKICVPKVHDTTKAVLTEGLKTVDTRIAKHKQEYHAVTTMCREALRVMKRTAEVTDQVENGVPPLLDRAKHVNEEAGKLLAILQAAIHAPPADEGAWTLLRNKLAKALMAMGESLKKLHHDAEDLEMVLDDYLKQSVELLTALAKKTLVDGFVDEELQGLNPEHYRPIVLKLKPKVRPLTEALNAAFKVQSDLGAAWAAFLKTSPDPVPHVTLHETGQKPATLKLG